MSQNEKTIPVVIVGGGQAGLSLSWYLCREAVAHVVLEAGTACHSWDDERWDNFCLVTPNWQCRLPGHPYAGDDPHGFMVKSEIIDYVKAFRESFAPPLREWTRVTSVTRHEEGGYRVVAHDEIWHAQHVVIASGAYHDAVIPGYAGAIDPAIVQIHSQDYRNATQLPDGAVLVVGSGQSGAQIVEDLHLDGRKVHLCVGSAPRVSRFYRGRDIVDWLADMKFYDLTVDRHPLRDGARDKTNHYVTGRDGGHDLDLRQFAREGVGLHGTLETIRDEVAVFRPDLAENLDDADRTNADIKASIDAHIARAGIQAPVEAAYVPVWEPGRENAPLDLKAAGITAILWCIGFRPDYRWIDVPVFNGANRPVWDRGVTDMPGFYFLGLPWLHTWGSGRFSGISRDAAWLAGRITGKEIPIA
ncbi:MSMEG_0569 family flavin-dependent oxidoreductase [Gluconacetobacter sacchari]|uniref:MSMEG_0569 family flavin-dependent oxidoreductase n=2 Tax=Gluconacetobacter sacchari TaxID=92759 RepID=A0A7W4IDW3_9PROT|nr:MSMEG_0569 family flavin-dependent oxidoreductase [Gluconacetobacter sacchari]MBB2161101.1 MSMEG_0569 family flavin-dependent oxidoreductase [Gluconacetobacter sacchari]GBQ26291.1 flavin-containing monooxygenase [Gluconacetobacter sacchari DSM 12717]